MIPLYFPDETLSIRVQMMLWESGFYLRTEDNRLVVREIPAFLREQPE